MDAVAVGDAVGLGDGAAQALVVVDVDVDEPDVFVGYALVVLRADAAFGVGGAPEVEENLFVGVENGFIGNCLREFAQGGCLAGLNAAVSVVVCGGDGK